MRTPKVAIIGAGLAGLCAARRFAAAKPSLDLVVFEKQPFLGGVWSYDDADTSNHWFTSGDFLSKTSRGFYPAKNRDEFHSCIYNNLRTNLPKEVMKIPGFDYTPDQQSYITREEVLRNMEQFCNHFELNKYIKYNHMVKNVEKKVDDKRESWILTYQDELNKKSVTEIFDAVVVCNGHFEIPIYPDVTGIANFKGLLLHSRYYRDPSSFIGKKVIIIGSGASGLDISIDLSTKADEIVLSHSGRKTIRSPLPQNVKDFPLINHITDDGLVVFENGTCYYADVILFCTGYQLDYPFLGKSCKVEVVDNTLLCLYKHIFHYDHPSLSFIGINCKIIPAHIFDLQAQCALEVIQKRIVLPNKKVMKEDTEKEIEEKDSKQIPRRHFHTLGKRAWPYAEDLAKEFKCIPITKVVTELAKFTQVERSTNLLTYRNTNYKIVDDNSFEIIK